MRSIATITVLLTLLNAAWGQTDGESTATIDAADSVQSEVENLRGMLVDDADNGASHYRLGSLLMDNNGDLDEAISRFDRAVELGFQPIGAAYRLSRLYAGLGRQSEALTQLEIMAEGGFGLPSLIDDQTDYDTIRENRRFLESMETIRKNRFPCKSDKQRRAFDFWIGQWRVTQNGQFAGTNSIAPILGDCVLYEQWASAAGSHGKSLNYYDPNHDHWRQIWVDDSGTIIEFTGEARDGGIYYTAETVNPTDSSVTYHRFEFTQLDGGNVRQFWQTSSDKGESWQTIWDGLYEREERETN